MINLHIRIVLPKKLNSNTIRGKITILIMVDIDMPKKRVAIIITTIVL